MKNCANVIIQRTSSCRSMRKAAAKIAKKTPSYSESYKMIMNAIEGKLKKPKINSRFVQNAIYICITSNKEIYIGESNNAVERAYSHAHQGGDSLYKKDFSLFILTYCPKLWDRKDRHECERVMIIAAQAFCENNPEFTLLNKKKVATKTFALELFSAAELNEVVACEKQRREVLA